MYRAGDWLPVFRTGDFWRYFLDLDEMRDMSEYPELEHCFYEFPIDSDCALVLQFDDALCFTTLYLRQLGVEGLVAIGETGPHGVPIALRWAEVQAICACLACQDRRVLHPGIALLLLLKFVLLGADDDLTKIRAALDVAWRSTKAFGGKEITRLITHQMATALHGRHSPAWVEDPERGWVPDGDISSWRQPEFDGFPFTYLNDLVDRACRCAGISRPPAPLRTSLLPDAGHVSQEEREEARAQLLQAKELNTSITVTVGPNQRLDSVKLLYRGVARELGYTIRFFPLWRGRPNNMLTSAPQIFTVAVVPHDMLVRRLEYGDPEHAVEVHG